jgi:hypothetical protein
MGGNVAVVFRSESDLRHALRDGWRGYQVVDANADDARFDDPPGTIAGLAALVVKGGAARRDATGFVIDYPESEATEDEEGILVGAGAGGEARTRGFSLFARNPRKRYVNR